MRPFLLGLTGSIGMGKSTTAAMFADASIPVWSADDAVHRLYRIGGAAVPIIADLYPPAIADGAVDRGILKRWIASDPSALARLEQAVHPLVAADRAAFVAAQNADIVVLDVPLLFETGADAEMDATLTVTAPAEVQRARVLARPGMSQAQFQSILARQMPDAEKCARSNYVIETPTLESARAAVNDLIKTIRARHA